MRLGSAISRRQFLATSAEIGLGIAAWATTRGMAASQSVAGANDRVRLAVCGIRKRGFDHVRLFSQIPNVQVVALCDVDEGVLRQRLADMEKLGLPKPQTYTDPRKLLEDKSIDAVCIATPHHWHALIAIWACQAGKDVYVEKPCSHNWWESRQLMRAAKRYDRIVQHGTQTRSSASAREAIAHVQNGLIFYGSDGYLALGDEDTGNAYQAWLGSEMKPGPSSHQGGSRYHFANFIEVVRSRKQEDLHAPIAEAHISCTLVHLANASYRLGRTLNFDPRAEEVIGDHAANRLLRDADRGYRRPFVIPERV